ncbi:MAG: hypothetical protein D6707_04600, partial [Bacteroidetes bacterium]
MIAVADSGSTKSDWLFFDARKETAVETGGINPIVQNEKEMEAQLEPLGKINTESVKAVYFYGAGCSSPEYNSKVASVLARYFPNAEIHVAHDLLGAARALYDAEPIIACILGTGSNSCYYDGKNILEKVPALGYILGDEGSGAHIGKALLRMYFYHLADDRLCSKFEQWLGLSKVQIFDKIYRSPSPNRFLASLAVFASENRTHPYINDLLHNVFRQFVNYHVKCFENAADVPVSFV